ncbi:glycosyltransferase [Microbacterium oryzae]|uniref:glycosyltransferase family 2 protein n=1 Tax=Microbacterium oryzae TaxID=743009 RepID=UPI0025B1C528|nr:glycosyltransferase family 2 protein [Microbacterium oryzae]MDN3310117.1 glycosyltransferase [Microbacterium oryzae]
MLTYAIVVATRNRLAMLKTSLPLLLEQSRPADRIIVVDRSDDHEVVREYCEELASASVIPLEVHYGEAANLPVQRNQGLALVHEDVVAFPDDDSFWHPGTAAELMAVYEADVHHRYGGVSATETTHRPGSSSSEVPQAQRSLKDDVRIVHWRNRIERLLVPQPFNVYGEERIAELGARAHQDGLEHPLVETIGGFLMSFRTDVARGLLFDALLGSRIGYATHEDKDLGLRVLRSGLLIAAAPGAAVFHNVAPGKRAGGFDYGFFHVLNYAYISHKVFPRGSRALRGLRRYLRYKVFLYSLRRSDKHVRDIHRGASAAFAGLTMIEDAPRERLADAYEAVCERHRRVA